MGLIFSAPNIDGQDLLLQVLCKLFVLFDVLGHERIYLEWNGKTTVKNLLYDGLTSREEVKLLLHHKVVLLCQIDCTCVKFALFNCFGSCKLDKLGLNCLECVEFESEEERSRQSHHVWRERGWCIDAHELY